MSKFYFLLLALMASANISNAQLSGTITDTDGNPLPSASIYIAGSTNGVNSNTRGFYSIVLPAGESEVVFQYIGYKTEKRKVNNTGAPVKLDIALEVQTFDIAEVEINASGEDPAYQIIRNAISKREYYKNLINSYSCNVYIKGNQKIVKIPEKLLGQEVGTLDGILDTNRQGIIYLSESLSKFYYQAPDKTKEELISSKVSGNSRGFSFNRATAIQFSFYEPVIHFGRQLISPIAPEAMLFYKYRLEGSFFDEAGNEINKIKVIPRNASGPVFSGDIFIYENSWNIQSCRLGVTGKNINQEMLDTMWLSQQFVPGREKDQWVLFSQNIDFGIKILGIHLKGFFSAVFSDYDINRSFPDKFFTKELVKIDAESNKRNDQYWDTLRPVPLLAEEARDFHRKDSLEIVWHSKSFLDSTDRKNNKFTSNNLTFGYTYTSSYNKWSLNIGSPLTTIEFNPVQGFYTSLAVKYRKWKDEDETNWYTLAPELVYGFSDHRLRGALRFEKLFDKIHYRKLSLSAGNITEQFNDSRPVSATVNGLYNVYGKLNYLKMYDKVFVRAAYEQRLWDVFNIELRPEYAIRSSLNNTTNYSFRKKSDIYSPNFPGDTVGTFPVHQVMSLHTSLSWFPGVRYVTYPNRKLYFNQKLPVFRFSYRLVHAFAYENTSKEDYTLHNPEISMRYAFSPRFLGNTSIYMAAGNTAFTGGKPEIMDYRHFIGNKTILSKARNNEFRLLPYYDFSTLGAYAEAHVSHNFGGFFLSKIPLIKELKFEENLGAKLILQEKGFRYTEFSVGLSNIGWSLFRLFRLDYSWAFLNDKYYAKGLTIGVNLTLPD